MTRLPSPLILLAELWLGSPVASLASPPGGGIAFPGESGVS
jgi:hypothetical protein